MPVINIKFIEGIVATPEQKHELVHKMTEAFVGVLGDVVKPFTYVLIEEVAVGDWGIAGMPMPDLEYLTGPEHAQVVENANKIMRDAILEQKKQAAANGG
jgi:4-oxalocrotonate tautomerase